MQPQAIAAATANNRLSCSPACYAGKRRFLTALLLTPFLWVSTQSYAQTPAEPATPSASSPADSAAVKTDQPEKISQNAAGSSLTSEQQAILKQLNDNDYIARDLAMTTLLSDDALTDQTLDKFYQAANSAEQRVRLRQVAVHHTARRMSLKYTGPNDSAILGMSPAPQNNLPDDDNDRPPAVVVRWTFPGSVAFAHLRQGDVITRVDNKPIPASSQTGQAVSTFIQLIASRRAGDSMSFRVLRDEHELDITLKLGSDRALQGIYQSARTAQSRQFNAACAKEIQDRLDALDKLSPTPDSLKVTLPPANDTPEAPAENAAAEPAKPANANVKQHLNFDEIWND